MLTASAFVVISIGAFAMYSNPLFQPIAVGPSGDTFGLVGGMTAEHGVLSVAGFSALISGMVLSLVNRFDIAPGGFTYMFTLISLPFTGTAQFAFLPVMVLTGLALDAFTTLLKPAGTHWFRVMAGFGPLVLFGSYFLVHEHFWGIAWSHHVWLGAIVVGILVGILSSYLIRPTTVMVSPTGQPRFDLNPGAAVQFKNEYFQVW
ncbi:MAG: hypothetical protein U5K37_08385 [Natrialbaceae archaeon]|nr:hypothetical protein [Natrialbaceae archaeon]